MINEQLRNEYEQTKREIEILQQKQNRVMDELLNQQIYEDGIKYYFKRKGQEKENNAELLLFVW